MKEDAGKFYFSCVLIFGLIVSFSDPSYGQNKRAGKVLVSAVPIPFKKNETKNYRLKIIQPYSFDLKTLQKCLGSLAYQEREISWSKRKRVFDASVIKRLAPLMVEQFKMTGRNQSLGFKIARPSGKPILQGDTFLTPEGMHWRFTVMNYSKREIDDFSIMGDSWRLVPLKGQVYKKKQGHKNLIQDLTNWVVFKNFHPVASRIIKEQPVSKGIKDRSKLQLELDIKNRLRILKELKEEGLIDDEEYKNKRQGILKNL